MKSRRRQNRRRLQINYRLRASSYSQEFNQSLWQSSRRTGRSPPKLTFWRIIWALTELMVHDREPLYLTIRNHGVAGRQGRARAETVSDARLFAPRGRALRNTSPFAIADGCLPSAESAVRWTLHGATARSGADAGTRRPSPCRRYKVGRAISTRAASG